MCIHHHLISMHLLPITFRGHCDSSFCFDVVGTSFFRTVCRSTSSSSDKILFDLTVVLGYQSDRFSLSLAWLLSISISFVGKILLSHLLFALSLTRLMLCSLIWVICVWWLNWVKCVGIKIHHVSYVWRFVIIWLVYLKRWLFFLSTVFHFPALVYLNQIETALHTGTRRKLIKFMDDNHFRLLQ